MPACVPEVAALALGAAPRCGRIRLVCIDGPAGSGKTTLAEALCHALAAPPPVHMDDLYQGWDQPLGGPLATRVDDWLLQPWAAGRPGRYRRYDWHQRRFDPTWLPAPVAPVVVLEGCASASLRIRQVASLVVWVEAPADLRLRRGVDRDGQDLSEQWAAWQARESAHFAADGTREAAGVIIDGRTGSIVG